MDMTTIEDARNELQTLLRLLANGDANSKLCMSCIDTILQDLCDEKRTRTPEQAGMSIDCSGIQDQIEKKHWLNVHFRAFELAHQAWKEHIRANAVRGSRSVNSPGGAVLDPERDGP